MINTENGNTFKKSGFSSKKMAQEYANKIGMDLAEQHDVANRDDTLIDFFTLAQNI
ncbi:hypothetical protein [Lentilactobacillus kisonensis]|uniref:hypothetical protein n=1 Tax=Lentilactobacillus kisonensis TaxID=481722 RepID=UPI000B0EF951|nr:hypothetical protein [Lentilactobacillus kisonensis]